MNRDTVTCFWSDPSDRAEESLRRSHGPESQPARFTL